MLLPPARDDDFVVGRFIGPDEAIQHKNEGAEHNEVQQGFLDPHRTRLVC